MLGKIRLSKFRYLSLPFQINKNNISLNQVKSTKVKSSQVKSSKIKSNRIHTYERQKTEIKVMIIQS